MFGNISLVTIFFRLFNFGVLIAFFAFIFRRYFYQGISDHIAEKESFLKGLHQNNKVLEKQQHNLEMKIAQQDNKCKTLLAKIEIWQQAVAQQQQEWHAIQEVVMEDKVRRLQLQQDALNEDHLKRALLPKVLDQAEKKLVQEFTEPQTGQAFLADVIAQLSKEIQR
jgi:hypothetical protein